MRPCGSSLSDLSALLTASKIRPPRGFTLRSKEPNVLAFDLLSRVHALPPLVCFPCTHPSLFMSDYTYVPPSGGHPIDVNGIGNTIKVGTDSVAVLERTLEPGLLGAPPHCHQQEDETSLVLSGELTVLVGDETLTVEPGGLVVKPRGEFHTFWNDTDEPVRFYEIISPGGYESYFTDLAEILAQADGPILYGEGGPPEAVAKLSEQYDVEFDFEWMEELKQKHGLELEA